MADHSSNPRTVEGMVVSAKAHKTIKVRVDRRIKHPLYGKYIGRSSHVHAHDEDNDCREGDQVTVVECRPISKSKCWRLKSIDVRSLGA
ncbi:MAG: 30S ribosomal protein S17 [Pseudomonadales bacterium]|nr:30S ribosomal protein S17 [Pseudomonadales bacterium]